MSYLLFEQWVLGEAVPTKAKSLGINPEKPPDMTDPSTGATNASDPNNPPPDEGKDISAVDQPDQDPAADDEQPQENQDDAGEGAPEDQGGGDTPPADSGGGDDMSGDQGEDAGDGSEGGDEEGGEDAGDSDNPEGGDESQPEDELGQAEKELFKDLKPEQIALKERELRERFQDLYQVVAESIDKLNKVTKTTYDSNMLDLILRQLINLKDTILHSITKAFPTRTYVQNKIELQKLATIFNAITNSVRNIYEARMSKMMQNSKKKPLRGRDLDIYFTQDLGF